MLRRTLLKNAAGGMLTLLLGEALAQVGVKSATPAKSHKGVVKQSNIRIHAQRFFYSPNHITITQGDKVVLELTSGDFTHGFSIPDWNLRSDIVPEQITLLTVTPQQAGEVVFLCDNFCGEGHETMHGIITVKARA